MTIKVRYLTASVAGNSTALWSFTRPMPLNAKCLSGSLPWNHDAILAPSSNWSIKQCHNRRSGKPIWNLKRKQLPTLWTYYYLLRQYTRHHFSYGFESMMLMASHASHGKCTLISCNLNNTVKQEVPKEAKSQSIAAQAAGIKAPHLGSASRFSRPRGAVLETCTHAWTLPMLPPLWQGRRRRRNSQQSCLQLPEKIHINWVSMTQWLNDHPLRSEHHQIIIQCPSSVHPVSIQPSVHPRSIRCPSIGMYCPMLSLCCHCLHRGHLCAPGGSCMIDAHNLQGGIGLGRGDTPRRKLPSFWDSHGLWSSRPPYIGTLWV